MEITTHDMDLILELAEVYIHENTKLIDKYSKGEIAGTFQENESQESIKMCEESIMKAKKLSAKILKKVIELNMIEDL